MHGTTNPKYNEYYCGGGGGGGNRGSSSNISVLPPLRLAFTSRAEFVMYNVTLGHSLVLTPTATHDTSTTEGTVPEAASVNKHLILLMMDQPVRNM